MKPMFFSRLRHRILPVLLIAAAPFTSGANAQSWPAQSTPEWESLLAAGQAEGEVVVLGSPVLGDAFIQRFEEDTGISVSFISGRGREGRTRFSRETEAETSTVDVFFSGPTSLQLSNAGLLAPIGQDLVLPEVTTPSNWRGGRVPFVDTAGVYLPSAASYLSGFVLVNSDLVDVESIKNWQDLLDEAYRGKIASHDIASSGGGRTLATYLAEVAGIDFLDALFNGQEVTYTRDYRQLTDWVARGTYPIAFVALPRDITRYQAQGLDNLVVLQMEDYPGYLVGGGGVMAIAKNAAHPAASAVFANWVMSQHGQEAFSAANKTPSARLDVTDGPWPRFIEPVAGVRYLDTYTEAWVSERQGELVAMIAEMLEK